MTGACTGGTGAYHETRLARDPKRDIVWGALWTYYFRHLVPTDACVVDLGCGYGDFINHVQARRRIAIDRWPGFPAHLAPGVEAIVGDATDLAGLPDGAVDFVFASNLFEHLTQDDLARVLEQLQGKLSDRGEIAMLQPNYRYCQREYFDDYTHISIYSHISLADFLTAHGYEVLDVRPRFLPLTVKSRWPVRPWLIRLWLALPWNGLGKQMLLRARPRRRASNGAAAGPR